MNMNMPTIKDIKAARESFEANEPRDLFYRTATELVDIVLRRATSLSLVEAVAVLLQTWNSSFYRYNAFDGQHFLDIQELITRYQQVVMGYRQRTIESLADVDEANIKEIFEDFEKVLGPVGAAKCLHLLAPRYFPLWDRAIANAYELSLGPKGSNGDRYCCFMRITKKQSEKLGGEASIGRNPLKAIDEYNYCRYTKRWIGE